VYCIQTAEDILKLLSRSSSPIILVFFESKRRFTIPRGTLSAEAYNPPAVGKCEISDFNCRLSQKQYEIGPWLLLNVNSKSWMVDRSVSVPMTLSDNERRDARCQNFQADLDR